MGYDNLDHNRNLKHASNSKPTNQLSRTVYTKYVVRISDARLKVVMEPYDCINSPLEQ